MSIIFNYIPSNRWTRNGDNPLENSVSGCQHPFWRDESSCSLEGVVHDDMSLVRNLASFSYSSGVPDSRILLIGSIDCEKKSKSEDGNSVSVRRHRRYQGTRLWFFSLLKGSVYPQSQIRFSLLFETKRNSWLWQWIWP